MHNVIADFRRIKNILCGFSSNLIVQRAQVQEHPEWGDADAYLRDQLKGLEQIPYNFHFSETEKNAFKVFFGLKQFVVQKRRKLQKTH